jgi:hypothetical protein
MTKWRAEPMVTTAPASAVPFLPTVERLKISGVIPGSRHGQYNPYRLLAGYTESGIETTCLCCASVCGQHFDHLHHLIGQTVRVYCTENGLKLRPLHEQPKEVQGHFIECLEAWDANDETYQQLRIEDPMGPESDQSLQEKEGSSVVQHERLTELATTVAHLAHEFGLPTAMWVHLPPE